MSSSSIPKPPSPSSFLDDPASTIADNLKNNPLGSFLAAPGIASAAGAGAMAANPGQPQAAQSAGAPPTLGSATTDALQNQLQQEIRMRASATLLAGQEEEDSPVTMSAGTSLLGA